MTDFDLERADDYAQSIVDSKPGSYPITAVHVARQYLNLRRPTECTCEYPYPREIWCGHHPHCALNQREEERKGTMAKETAEERKHREALEREDSLGRTAEVVRDQAPVSNPDK